MLKAVLGAINPARLVVWMVRPFYWDITSYCGDWEVETNVLTGDVRHRMIVSGLRGSRPSAWRPGQPPDQAFVPVDLDALPSAADIARRFAPPNAPIAIPGNEP